MHFSHKQIKKVRNSHLLLFVIVLLFMFLTGCKKFLDEKPSRLLVEPQTLQDLERLLINSSTLNSSSAYGYGEALCDNIYTVDAYLNLFNNANPGTADQVQNYIWASQALGRTEFWFPPYTNPIYYSNIVLDQLNRISYEPKDSILMKTLKGSALFIRAFHFHALAQAYCRPYDSEYLSFPGIVVRLTSDAGVITQRSTVKETYDKIIDDLKEAAQLLPINNSLATRPTQAAAYAALARVYLSMRDYPNARLYANLALSQKSALLDYNTRIPVNPNKPFASFHPEIIFDASSTQLYHLNNSSFVNIDSTLYNSYDANDLRKVLYFQLRSNGIYRWNGSYNTSNISTGGYPGDMWVGLATDELYLIRAECSARAGSKDSAINDLNRLLITRWNNQVPYPTISASNVEDALSKVLNERRKELVYRGQRWSDIRRFNLEGANITLKRIWAGTTYTLPPNDKRTVMRIPDSEIALSGIEQNPR